MKKNDEIIDRTTGHNNESIMIQLKLLVRGNSVITLGWGEEAYSMVELY